MKSEWWGIGEFDAAGGAIWGLSTSPWFKSVLRNGEMGRGCRVLLNWSAKTRKEPEDPVRDICAALLG